MGLFNKWRNYPTEKKLNFFFMGFMVLALPVLVFSLKPQKETTTNASSGPTALEQAQFIEDGLPADPAAQRDSSKLAANIAKVNAIKSPKAESTVKPNIVVIMLDDVNPMDEKMWAAQVTPNINSTFVIQGMDFLQYYGETSLCCPGRVNFFTGQHTQNHGVADLDGTKFNPSDSVATELQSSGYYTMLVGKYLNFFNLIPEEKAIPPGWSQFDGMYTGNGKYYNYKIISSTSSGHLITSYGNTEPDYSTDVETNIAVTRLKQADPTKPIFLYVAPTSSHGPFTAAERYKGDPRCAGMTWTPPNYNEADVSDKPNYVADKPLLSATAYSVTKYCQTLLAADDMVGRIKAELATEGRLDNTIFVLTADNGMSWGEHRLEAKTTPYATHLPLFITWPSGRGTTSATINTTISNIDLAPTFCEVAGCVMGPYPNGQVTADGKSFFSLLKNQSLPWTRDAILESQPIVPVGQASPEDRPAWWAVRTTDSNPAGLWHYIEYDSGEKELYDLSGGPCYLWTPDKPGDPCELNNLLSSSKPITDQTLTEADSFHSKLTQLKAEKGDGGVPLPTLPSCKWKSPTIGIPVPTPTGSGKPGTTLSYSVTFIDNDSTQCGSRTLAISLDLPSSTWTYSPATVTLNPQQATTIKITVTSPSNAKVGTKNITVNISGVANKTVYLTKTITYTVLLPQ